MEIKQTIYKDDDGPYVLACEGLKVYLRRK